jgi:hypothetical protein
MKKYKTFFGYLLTAQDSIPTAVVPTNVTEQTLAPLVDSMKDSGVKHYEATWHHILQLKPDVETMDKIRENVIEAVQELAAPSSSSPSSADVAAAAAAAANAAAGAVAVAAGFCEESAIKPPQTTKTYRGSGRSVFRAVADYGDSQNDMGEWESNKKPSGYYTGDPLSVVDNADSNDDELDPEQKAANDKKKAEAYQDSCFGSQSQDDSGISLANKALDLVTLRLLRRQSPVVNLAGSDGRGDTEDKTIAPDKYPRKPSSKKRLRENGDNDEYTPGTQAGYDLEVEDEEPELEGEETDEAEAAESEPHMEKKYKSSRTDQLSTVDLT